MPTKKELEAENKMLKEIIIGLGGDLDQELEKFLEENNIKGIIEHEMVLIPAGEFIMGALPDDEDAKDRKTFLLHAFIW